MTFVMDNIEKPPSNMPHIPSRTELLAEIGKVGGPIVLAIMTKIAGEYKKGKRISFLQALVIAILAGAGAIVGYWVSKGLAWTEYKMVLTIYFFGLMSDKFFDFLFSKTILNAIFNVAQDWLVDNLNFALKIFQRKK